MGSSPLTRGKRDHRPILAAAHGLIPAHAGKTTHHPGQRPHPGAHPRSRGENTWASSGAGRAAGSSPLTRGKPAALGHHQHAGGLIPAHAGKTACSCAAWTRRRAHPRSRGENMRSVPKPSINEGSSPLTRGKPRPIAPATTRIGLIPAHAGKTRRPCGRSRGSRAHPRSRGENLVIESRQNCWAGSSPLTRGKLDAPRSLHVDGRLIPAHAGKTDFVGCDEAPERAHPRSRGENAIFGVSSA